MPQYFSIWQSKEMSHNFVRGQSATVSATGASPMLSTCWACIYNIVPTLRQRFNTSPTDAVSTLTVEALGRIFYILPTWNCVSLSRPTTSSGLKILIIIIFLRFKKKYNVNRANAIFISLIHFLFWRETRKPINCYMTANIESIFMYSWPTVCDAGPSLKQHWLSVACLLGCCSPA